MPKIISRIAPTPSGFLHVGNAFNFILTYLYTRAQDGLLHLRIDDYDSTRYRPKYVQNIFDVLHFLGIDYDEGARNLSDFEANFSLNSKINRYKRTLENLDAYACSCSKNSPNAYKNGIYQQICINKNLKFKVGETAIRLCVDKDEKIGAKVAKTMGDFVIWKKDDTPSYNLASVIDDENLGVNFIVRGRDLIACSRAQIYLARKLNFKFQNAKFIHHELFKMDGKKLSKSAKAPGIELRLGAKFYYKIVAQRLNLDLKSADSLENLLYEFKLRKKI